VTLATAAAARNYLPRQRYRLSRQIARRVSRHLVVPLLSFLIRRRDKRGRAGLFRSVPDGLRHRDMIDFRTAPRRDIIPWSALCGDERDRYARSVAARLSETERETRGAPRNFLRPFNRPRRTFFEFSAWYGCCPARLVSLVFFCSQRETSENSPIGVAQPAIFNEFVPLIRFPGKNLCSRNVDSKYIGEILTFPFELSVFSQRVLNFCFDITNPENILDFYFYTRVKICLTINLIPGKSKFSPRFGEICIVSQSLIEIQDLYVPLLVN